MFKINQTKINVSGFLKRYQSIERDDNMVYTEQFITIPKSNFTWFSMCLKYIILKTYGKIRWYVFIIIILNSLKVKEKKILTVQVFHFI